MTRMTDSDYRYHNVGPTEHDQILFHTKVGAVSGLVGQRVFLICRGEGREDVVEKVRIDFAKRTIFVVLVHGGQCDYTELEVLTVLG